MMPFIQADGAQIYCKLEGPDEAPALVLLNSIGTDMDLWALMLPRLRERFRLLRIDTRGHGASDAPGGDYSLAMLADDVFAAMDAYDIARASVAGVSLGGMIAMEMALARPIRVQRLALVCTSATMDPLAWDARVATVRTRGMAAIADLAMGRFLSAEFIAANPASTATVRRQLITMAAEGYAGCAAAIRDMDIAPRLGDIGCPTLVVTGDRDVSTPHDGHGEHLVGGIGMTRHVVLPTGHLAPLEMPDALSDALLTFFQD